MRNNIYKLKRYTCSLNMLATIARNASMLDRYEGDYGKNFPWGAIPLPIGSSPVSSSFFISSVKNIKFEAHD